MKPIRFPDATHTFGEGQDEYQNLPAQVRSGHVVTKWVPSSEEMELLKKGEGIYLSQRTFGQPLQPIYLTMDKSEVDAQIDQFEEDLYQMKMAQAKEEKGE